MVTTATAKVGTTTAKVRAAAPAEMWTTTSVPHWRDTDLSRCAAGAE